MDASPQDREARVAIVYDDEGILDALQLLLEVSGWEVRAYKSGEAFVDDISEIRPDCLILDFHLPGLSGVDIARMLSTQYPKTPIIGIVNQGGSKIANEVLSAGDNVMLTRPVSAELILAKLQSVMA